MCYLGCRCFLLSASHACGPPPIAGLSWGALDFLEGFLPCFSQALLWPAWGYPPSFLVLMTFPNPLANSPQHPDAHRARVKPDRNALPLQTTPREPQRGPAGGTLALRTAGPGAVPGTMWSPCNRHQEPSLNMEP